MAEKIRRVVTGHDRNRKSVFVIDGDATAVRELDAMPGLAVTDLWQTAGAPADNRGQDDAAARPLVLEPPPSGTIFRIVEFPPDNAWRDRPDARAAFDAIGGGHAPDRTSDDPMMHRTSTVDYLVVLKGEIWAVLDTGEIRLKQGDTMVQRGTNHSWSVRTEEPCLLAVILVNAGPV